MKKFLLSAIAMLAMSASSFAYESTYYVKDKSGILAAFKAANSMQDGDVTTIVICNSLNEEGEEGQVADNSLVINAGNIVQKDADVNLPFTGKLIVKSNQTDVDNLPQLQFAFDYREFEEKSTSKLSLFFENVSLQFRSGVNATSGQILYWEKMTMEKMQLDSVVIRNCEITNCPRTFFRTAPTDGKVDAEGNPLSPSKINYFEISGCKVHNMNQASGNNWAFLVFGSMPVEVKLFNNMFYDMPFTKGLLQMAYVNNDGTAPKIYVYNNTIMLAKAQYSKITVQEPVLDEEKQPVLDGDGNPVMQDVEKFDKNNGYCFINAGNYLDASTEYYFYNNLFLTPKMGAKNMPSDPADMPDFEYVVNGSEVVSAKDKVDEVTVQLGYITASNNYMDEAYKAFDRGTENDFIEHNLQDEGMEFDWSAFFKPAVSNFLVENSNVFATAGVSEMPLDMDATQTVAIAPCVGAPMMYVDAFPQEAKVNVTIEGSKFVDLAISPEKDTYKVGDEITLTLNDHNSYYRTFNTFKGWSDGSMETTRTVTITDIEGINLTANYEYGDSIVAAFDFSKVSGNMAEYKADLGKQADVARIFAMAADTTGIAGAIQTEALPYVAGKFQTRTNKFGEDPIEQQMAIISRRTAKAARDFNRDYAVLEFSTKALRNVQIDAFVGSDNNCSKNQLVYYSLDNENWTLIEEGTVQPENGIWSNVHFTLPAAAEGQDVVYVKFQGEITGGDNADNCIYTPVESAFDPSDFHAYDVFEYMGNILITGEAFDFTALDNAIAAANTALTTLKADATKAMVTEAITTAQAVYESAGSQEDITAAASALNKAVAEATSKDMILSMKALEVTDGVTLKKTSLDEAKTYFAEGWFMPANGLEPANAMTKKSTIDAETDNTISAANQSGITIKNNSGKQYYVKVKYATNAKFYSCTDKDNERNAIVSIYGTDVKKETGNQPKNTGAVIEFADLDPTQEYIFFVEATADMDFYAMKFVGDMTGVDAAVAEAEAAVGGVKKVVKNGKLVIVKGDAEFNAAGAQIK